MNMTTTKTYPLTIDRDMLICRLLECQRLLDETQHWCAVRVSETGEVYVSEEHSPCYSDSEYFKRMPHRVTVFSANGNGQCNVDWGNADAVAAERAGLWKLADDCIQRLADAGYEVEVDHPRRE